MKKNANIGKKVRLKTKEDLDIYFKKDDDEGAYYFYNKRKYIFYPYNIMGREFRVIDVDYDGFFHVSGGWDIHPEHCYIENILPDNLFEV